MKNLQFDLFKVSCLLFTVFSTATFAKDKDTAFHALLNGFNEVPSVVTKNRGKFEARLIEGGSKIEYKLTYPKEANIAQAHIHIGQSRTNGGVVVFLCQTETNQDPTDLAPNCTGEDRGMIDSGNIIGPDGQGVAPGNLAAVLKAMRTGAAYVNVHSPTFPSGEFRGQVKSRRPFYRLSW